MNMSEWMARVELIAANNLCQITFDPEKKLIEVSGSTEDSEAFLAELEEQELINIVDD